MAVSFLLFSLAVGLVAIEGKPAESVPKTLSLPLHRHWEPLAEDAQQPLPLAANGIESLVYTINVRVGSTAQHVNLTLDTNSQGSVLFSKGYTAQNRSCSKGQAQRNFFDASRSSSYVQTADSVFGWGIYRYPYVGVECHQAIGWAEDLYGVWGQDTYSFGPLSVPNVPFILSNFTFWPLNPRWPSDGIFPLGLMGGEALSTIFNKVGGNQEISLFLNGAPSQSGKGSVGGQITFGGKDTTNCASNWKTLTTASDEDWSLWFSKVQVGSKVIYGGSDYGELSIASPLLEVPAGYYRTLIKQFNAQYNYELDLYTVDCGKVSSLPGVELKLDIGFGIDYTVPPSKFVATLSTKSGPVCALLIVQGGDGWIFGSQFLPNRCVHLDYANNYISFADPKK